MFSFCVAVFVKTGQLLIGSLLSLCAVSGDGDGLVSAGVWLSTFVVVSFVETGVACLFSVEAVSCFTSDCLVSAGGGSDFSVFSSGLFSDLFSAAGIGSVLGSTFVSGFVSAFDGGFVTSVFVSVAGDDSGEAAGVGSVFTSLSFD